MPAHGATPPPPAEAGAPDRVGFTPPKDVAAFRVYAEDPAAASGWDASVYEHYRQMRERQCVAFADRLEPRLYDFAGRQFRMTVRQALDKLSDFVDRSDPDLTLPNFVHALQTAERARAAGKPDWFVLTALVHDVGKMMFCLPGSTSEDGLGGKADEPQFALGGDTWVLGCAIPGCAVFPALSARNPDAGHPVLGSEQGVYQDGCGIMVRAGRGGVKGGGGGPMRREWDGVGWQPAHSQQLIACSPFSPPASQNLRYIVGHDEYTYRMLLANRPPLAAIPEALAIVRLHSCYPLHSGGAYRRFHAPGDEALLDAVRDFNRFDLYSKDETAGAAPLDVEALWPYYQALVDKYLPGELLW